MAILHLTMLGCSAKGASIALPVTMLFSAITLESLLFSADRIGFFAVLSRIAINSHSFHSTLMLELTKAVSVAPANEA